jgi:hypothetical protein
VFIFDRSFLPVAAGLLTALLFVGVGWWMDGGFVDALRTAEGVADREIRLALGGERRFADEQASLVVSARPDPLEHEAPMLVSFESVPCSPGVTGLAGITARASDIALLPASDSTVLQIRALEQLSHHQR